MTPIKLDCRRITDKKSFHDTFSSLFGFPATYGHNMDAWIDCLTYLDKPEAGMTKVSVPKGGVVTLWLEHVEDFSKRRPELYRAIVEGAAFVNFRRVEMKQAAVLALAFEKG